MAWQETDRLAVEEPLEIRLEYVVAGTVTRTNIAVTMRTPGNDVALAVGFLFTENIVRQYADVDTVRHTPAPNVLTVRLKPGVAVDTNRLKRHFYTTSSCGVCGKTSLEALEIDGVAPLADGLAVDPTVVHQLPGALQQAQTVFAETGGLHAAALFSREGALLRVCEDVGRHNAVDKVIGACLLEGQMPLADCILFVSGRASFELTQKSLVAGIPVLAAVSAPSSLAVDLAQAFNLTLLGFVRNDRFNIYAAPNRIDRDALTTNPTLS